MCICSIDASLLVSNSVVGSEEELRQRVERFDEDISTQKQLRRTAEGQHQDSEEELRNARNARDAFVAALASHITEAKVGTGFDLNITGILNRPSTNNNESKTVNSS